MTKKKGEMSDRFPNLSAPTTATTKEIADEDSISSNFKVKKLRRKVILVIENMRHLILYLKQEIQFILHNMKKL